MPYFETPDELADYLANLAEIYRDTRCTPQDDGEILHFSECNCRVFWVPWMADRIRDAVTNEQKVTLANYFSNKPNLR